MPFVAKDKITGKRVDITKLEKPRLMLQADSCICQLCEKPMVIKAGLHRRAHFAHHKGECVSDYERDPDTSPESPQHLAAKDWLRGMLPTHYVEYRDARLEFEVPIIEVRRVVDLLAVFPTGHKVAHEIQLSPITPEVLQQRTDDYEQAGIDVVWWLGKSAKTEANQDWCMQTFGLVFIIDHEQIYKTIHDQSH